MIELMEVESGTTATIVPSLGATLHSFSILHDTNLVNVIDFYDSAGDFEANVTSKGLKSCKLSPFACRMKDASYNLNGHSYTVHKYILNGSALHGLIYDASFTATDEFVAADHASVTFSYQYNATDSGYPFVYTCAVTYTLRVNNELVITTNITNNDTTTIPMQDGWHPYFTFGKKN